MLKKTIFNRNKMLKKMEIKPKILCDIKSSSDKKESNTKNEYKMGDNER